MSSQIKLFAKIKSFTHGRKGTLKVIMLITLESSILILYVFTSPLLWLNSSSRIGLKCVCVHIQRFFSTGYMYSRGNSPRKGCLQQLTELHSAKWILFSSWINSFILKRCCQKDLKSRRGFWSAFSQSNGVINSGRRLSQIRNNLLVRQLEFFQKSLEHPR